MSVTVAFFLALIVAGSILVLVLWPSAAPDVEELGGARCILNERTLRIDNPIPLSGRLDRVWLLKDGVLVITDTKRRPGGRYYEGDRVQLSAYKVLLQNTPAFQGRRIADYGYLQMTGHGKKARYVRVPLMTEDRVIERYRRALEVRAGRSKSIPNPSRGLCAGCGHRKNCDAAV